MATATQMLRFGTVLWAVTSTISCGYAAGPPSTSVRVDTVGGIERVTNSDSVWRGRGWRLDSLSSIDPPLGSDGELIAPASLAWTDDGRLLVADRSPASVKLFDGDGRFVRQIGRDGAGPGEYQSPMVSVTGDTVIVQDASLTRLTMFDTTGKVVRSWPSVGHYHQSVAVLDDGTLWVPTITLVDSVSALFAPAYVRFRRDGTVVDTTMIPTIPVDAAQKHVWHIRGGSSGSRTAMTTAIPFAPTVEAHPLATGRFIGGSSASYQLVESRDHLDTLRIITRPWKPVPIPRDERVAAVEREIAFAAKAFTEGEARRVYRLEDVPTVAAAFLGISEDRDANVWVRIPSPRTNEALFDVFDGRRSWLGQLVVSARLAGRAQLAWGPNRLAVVAEDGEGRPYIARYRLVKEQ